ncbi:MAG: hypothetical protein JXB20_02150 [Bacilli bacterium]|nr:hypothetical protein [Bacilli bacterium]
MKKYWSLLKYEFKTLLKDSMNLFMILYPLLMLFICGFLLPAILERTAAENSNAETITLLIGFTLVLSLGGYVMGAMLGFSLLENKDENTLQNIAATPITVSGYTNFKTVYSFVLSFFGNMVMVGGLKLIASNRYELVYGGVTIRLLDQLSWGNVVIFSLVSSLMVPTIGLVISSIAKNKIEGFAFMKSGGLIIMIPLLALLNTFMDWKQYFLGIAPNFWVIKPLLNEVLLLDNASDLPFWLYMLIGAVYMIVLAIVTQKMFLKKAHLK